MKLNVGGIRKLVRALRLEFKRSTKDVASEGLDSQRHEPAAPVLAAEPTAGPTLESTPKETPAPEDEQALAREAIPLPEQPSIPCDADLSKLLIAPAGALIGALDYFASHTRAFTMSEFLEWLGPDDVTRDEASNALLSDQRFVNLGEVEGEGHWLVGERALFRFWGALNVRLARVKRPRLTERELVMSMGSLRLEGKWERPPKAALDFGLRYGLLAAALQPGDYVFPLALMLSYMRVPAVECAKRLLDRLAGQAEREGLLRLATLDVVAECLSSFDHRVVGVAIARAGLTGGKKPTLQALGEHLGITRERVRQLESKFWTAVLDTKREARLEPIVRVFLCDLIARQGSLLVDMTLPEGRVRCFLAECLHVPWLDISAELLALGVQDQATHDPDTLNVELPSEAKSERFPKYRRVDLALQQIGRPAHYTEVANVYNELFPDDPCSPHNVHAMLGRGEPDIVWIGVRGTYAFRKWGFDKPADGLYEQIAAIVKRVYAETQSPVPLSVIAAELGRIRPIVHPTSLVLATGMNPTLKRVGKDSFVPMSAVAPSTEDAASSEVDTVLKNFERRSK